MQQVAKSQVAKSYEVDRRNPLPALLLADTSQPDGTYWLETPAYPVRFLDLEEQGLFDSFAVHRNPHESNEWVVTHVRTGRKLTYQRGYTIGEACEIAANLIRSKPAEEWRSIIQRALEKDRLERD